VSEQVQSKASAIGVQDISRMTKAEALAALAHKINTNALTPREATAIRLVDHMVTDPHTIDDAFFHELQQHFGEDEIIELVFAAALYMWGSHFAITMRVDTDEESTYPHNLTYAEASGV
jgi:alkylhydroperoxidase family enzyme